MWFSYLFFILVGAICVAAAVGVVASNKPVHRPALFLLAQFAMLAALYITMDAQFLGAAQIIIYAGGIVILILFVIMLLGSEAIETRAAHRIWVPWVALGLGLLLLIGLSFSMAQAFTGTSPNPAAGRSGRCATRPRHGALHQIHPAFEMIGVLLLVALIGALLLARKQPTAE